MNSKRQKIAYEHLDQEFLAAFPEFRDRYKEAFDYWGDDWSERPGSYLVFGIVVFPYVIALLESGRNNQMLTRLFLFFELMADSDDAEVLNLLGLEMFDKLLHDPARLARAWRYMGNSSKGLVKEAAKRLNLERNLPR